MQTQTEGPARVDEHAGHTSRRVPIAQGTGSALLCDCGVVVRVEIDLTSVQS